MAELTRDRFGNYRLRFRVLGKYFQRSLHTSDKKEASSAKERVEETLRDVKLGRIAVPHGVDVATWILGGGRLDSALPVRSMMLKEAVDSYFESIPDGAKEQNSLKTERIHLSHFLRILKARTQVRSLTRADLQRYISIRSKETGRRGNRISRVTIEKELKTFGLLWNYVESVGVVSEKLDRTKLVLPKHRTKLRFHTIAEIGLKIAQGCTPEEEEDLWDALYLRESEVLGLLEVIENHAKQPWLGIAAYVAAFTGARRSEILRIKESDIDMRKDTITIREKKRVHGQDVSFRVVDMHYRLKTKLQQHLNTKPESPYLICNKDGTPVTVNQATDAWRQTLKNTNWSVVRGWHTLRHSFASICASKGVRESTISAWMGHETEEMRERYRHLFPEDTSAEMARLFT